MFRKNQSGYEDTSGSKFSLVTGTTVVTYLADNLPCPRLIGDIEFGNVMKDLGYNMIQSDVKRNRRIKNNDFIVDSTGDYLSARNRGWGIVIDVEYERTEAHNGWQIKITGKPQNKNAMERIAKSLEEETYSKAKNLKDTHIISKERYSEILNGYGISEE